MAYREQAVAAGMEDTAVRLMRFADNNKGAQHEHSDAWNMKEESS